MRIGLSTTTVEIALAGGISDGIAHYTSQLRHGLQALGNTVEAFSFTRPIRKRGKALQFSRPMPAEFPILAGAGILTGGRARIFAPEVDVFHSTDFKVVPTRCPVVATIWDAIPLKHPEWLSARARLMAPLAIRRSAYFADRIICATRHAAGDVVRYFGIGSDRISIVPWGIDAAWLEAPAADDVAATLHRHGLEPGFILTIGTVQPRKNLGALLDAYAALPASLRNDHRLVVVGREGWGSEGTIQRLRELVSTGRAVWLNNLQSDAEVRHLYQAAHLFVLPSLYEGFGIPILEAFASSVPVVCSNLTSLPEVAAGAAIEVDPMSSTAMADAMATLLTSGQDRAECVRRGRERAAFLSVDRAVRATMEVYQQV